MQKNKNVCGLSPDLDLYAPKFNCSRHIGGRRGHWCRHKPHCCGSRAQHGNYDNTFLPAISMCTACYTSVPSSSLSFILFQLNTWYHFSRHFFFWNFSHTLKLVTLTYIGKYGGPNKGTYILESFLNLSINCVEYLLHSNTCITGL